MKYIPLFFCLLIITLRLNAQSNLKAKQVYNDIFVLNSNGHKITGEGSRIIKEIPLPPNTVKWYYSFYASRDLADVQDVKNYVDLLAEVSKLVDKTGISSKVIKVAGGKPNSTYCDVCFFRSANDQYNFLAGRPVTGIDIYSRKNGVASEAIEISDAAFLTGTQYLGFRNNNSLYPLKLRLQVVAIVNVPMTKNGWTREQRNELFNIMKTAIKNKTEEKYTDEKINALAGCLIGKLTTQYSYEQFNSFADYERSNALKALANECKSEVLK